MNLAESIKFVLKKKSKNVLNAFNKKEILNILKEVAGDVIIFSQEKNKIFKTATVKGSLLNLGLTIKDTTLLIKVLPQRINHGLKLFSEEFANELDKLSDQKQKTIFCMKVLAGLSKFTLSTIYGVGLGNKRLLGLGKGKNIYTQIILARLVYKTIQTFIISFIQEIEKEVTDPAELKSLQDFKNIITDDKGNAVDKIFEGVIDPEDPAFKIVENLKNYVFTGELK